MTQTTLNSCLAAVKASMKRNGHKQPTNEDWNAGYRRHLAMVGKSGRRAK